VSTALKILDDSLFNFEVESESEVFDLAKTYQKDINEGMRSIAISSMGYRTSQQKILLGIATYYALVQGKSVLIISDLIDCGVFKDYVELANRRTLKGVEYFELENFNFVSLKNVKYLAAKNLKSFTNTFDLSFTDVPDLIEIKKKPESYSEILSLTEVLSVVSFKNKNTLLESEEIFNYFEKFGIDLKGTLIEM